MSFVSVNLLIQIYIATTQYSNAAHNRKQAFKTD